MCDWDNYETNPNTGMRCPQVLCVHHTMSLKRDALKKPSNNFPIFSRGGTVHGGDVLPADHLLQRHHVLGPLLPRVQVRCPLTRLLIGLEWSRYLDAVLWLVRCHLTRVQLQPQPALGDLWPQLELRHMQPHHRGQRHHEGQLQPHWQHPLQVRNAEPGIVFSAMKQSHFHFVSENNWSSMSYIWASMNMNFPDLPWLIDPTDFQLQV